MQNMLYAIERGYGKLQKKDEKQKPGISHETRASADGKTMSNVSLFSL
jgi:hypothetical protein